MARAPTFRLSLYLATRARRAPARNDGTEAAQKRRGTYSTPRPEGALIWFHAGRAEDIGAIREIADRISAERQDACFLVTTSGKAQQPDMPALLQTLAPDETLPATRKFLDHWKPDIGMWTGPDLRPALTVQAKQRGIPLLMVETKEARSVATQGFARGLTGDVLELFDRIYAGSKRSAGQLRQLGASNTRIEVLGFLQEGTPALPCNETDRADLADQMGGRPAWLASAVTPNELEAVLAAHRSGLRRSHRLLLILAPADLGDAERIAQRLRDEDLPFGQRSAEDELTHECAVYLADTEGEMGLWYRLAPVSFLGKSLGAGSGVNPFEAAALGSAVIHGPNISDFQPAFARLSEAGASRLVRNAAELAAALEALLSPATAAEMARRGWEVTSEGASVTDRLIDVVLSRLELS